MVEVAKLHSRSITQGFACNSLNVGPQGLTGCIEIKRMNVVLLVLVKVLTPHNRCPVANPSSPLLDWLKNRSARFGCCQRGLESKET
jgi:hypothetical protein